MRHQNLDALATALTIEALTIFGPVDETIINEYVCARALGCSIPEAMMLASTMDESSEAS